MNGTTDDALTGEQPEAAEPNDTIVDAVAADGGSDRADGEEPTKINGTSHTSDPEETPETPKEKGTGTRLKLPRSASRKEPTYFDKIKVVISAEKTNTSDESKINGT